MKQVLIALDQLAHALVGGMADETLSAAAWRWQIEGKRTWPRRMIDLLFFDPDHCKTSYEAEKQRSQLPPEYRT